MIVTAKTVSSLQRNVTNKSLPTIFSCARNYVSCQNHDLPLFRDTCLRFSTKRRKEKGRAKRKSRNKARCESQRVDKWKNDEQRIERMHASGRDRDNAREGERERERERESEHEGIGMKGKG